VAEPADGHRRALVSVKVAGTPLAEASLRALAEVRVEQSLHVPDAFTLRFNDHDLSLLGGSKFDLGVEVGDDGRIGLDRGGPSTRRRPCGSFVRERRDEVASVEDGLERVPDERIGFP